MYELVSVPTNVIYAYCTLADKSTDIYPSKDEGVYKDFLAGMSAEEVELLETIEEFI